MNGGRCGAWRQPRRTPRGAPLRAILPANAPPFCAPTRIARYRELSITRLQAPRQRARSPLTLDGPRPGLTLASCVPIFRLDRQRPLERCRFFLPHPCLQTRPRYLLVLGSGGARGMAHIGVIQWLAENGYTIRSIAGTSIGALVGGIYAASKLEIYAEWVLALERMHVLRLLDPTIGRPRSVQGRAHHQRPSGTDWRLRHRGTADFVHGSGDRS